MSEEMSRDEAAEQLKQWARTLEIDTENQRFTDVIDELVLPVMHERLAFNPDDESFTYKLVRPIENQNSTQEMITIREMTYQQSKKLDKFKDNENVAQATTLIAASCGLALGEAERLGNRDIRKINAVILGFFA